MSRDIVDRLLGERDLMDGYRTPFLVHLPSLLKDAADRIDLLEGLLEHLHWWFETKAPEHYKGCGLHIDVVAALASRKLRNLGAK